MRANIENLVISFVENYKKSSNFRTVWDKPLIGFANANDPLFLELKKTVNKNHKIPIELLSRAKSIISYFIPFNQEVVLSNTKGKKASIEWAIAYILQ